MFSSTTRAVLFASTFVSAAWAAPAPFKDTAPGLKGADGTAQMTYYTPGEAQFVNAAGACGIKNTVNDPIVAIAHEYFDSFGVANPNNNPLCNKNIKVNFGGKYVVATITDRCADCEGKFNVDLTPSAITKILPDYLNKGRVTGVTWDFTDEPAGSTGSSDAGNNNPGKGGDKPSPTPEQPKADPTPAPQPPKQDPTPAPQPPKQDPTPAPQPPKQDPTPTPDQPKSDPAPAPAPSAQPPSDKPTYDDGFYHPDPKFDNGMYHPGPNGRRSFKNRLA